VLTVAPLSSATIQVRLRGTIAPGDDYRLTVGTQPMAHPDELRVEFEVGDDPAIDDDVVVDEREHESVVRIVART
jgi:hypothetical protein